jgi:hypothetical protein
VRIKTAKKVESEAMPMNSKQRVHAALRREPVDRLPIFMWFHPQTAERLARLLEIPTACLAEAMGDDVRQTWVNNNYAMEGIVHENEGESHVDIWGVEWTRQYGFNQLTGFPLAKASRDEVLRYQFPIDHLEVLMRLMLPVMAHQRDYFDDALPLSPLGKMNCICPSAIAQLQSLFPVHP